MFFADRITLGTPRRTKEGYMAVRAKATRAGIFDYLGREIDPEGEHFAADAVVKVYRPEEEVFATDSVASFLMKPITDDHPANPVTAATWASQAKGVNAGALRDGEYLAFDLVFMDADTIASIWDEKKNAWRTDAKRELSNGYSSEISVEDGLTPDGQRYDAVQRKIRGNHVAVVKQGRAGHECRIGDVALCDAATVELLERLLDERTYTDQPGGDKNTHQRREAVDNGVSQMATKTINFDGMPIESTDAAEAAIRKLEGQLADSKTAGDKAAADVAKLTTDNATLTADKAKLEQQLKDAELTPAKLQDAAKAYAATVASAKKIAPAVTVSDSMDESAIRRAVVAARLGDAAKDWSDDQVAISFDTLAAQSADAKVDPVRHAIGSMPAHVADAGAVVQQIRGSRYN